MARSWIAGAAALLIAEATGHPKLHALLAEQGIESLTPIAVFLGVGVVFWALAFWKKPILAWPALLIAVAGLWSYGITPVINGERSARDFMKGCRRSFHRTPNWACSHIRSSSSCTSTAPS